MQPESSCLSCLSDRVAAHVSLFDGHPCLGRAVCRKRLSPVGNNYREVECCISVRIEILISGCRCLHDDPVFSRIQAFSKVIAVAICLEGRSRLIGRFILCRVPVFPLIRCRIKSLQFEFDLLGEEQ